MTQRKSTTARPVHGDADIMRRAVRYLESIGRLDPLQVGVGTDLADILDEALKSGAIVRIRAANISAVPTFRRGERRSVKNSWTNEEDAILRGMYERGELLENIAEAVPGRSKSACQARAFLLGYQRPLGPESWDDEDDARLRLAVEAGELVHAIAADMGRSLRSIEGRCARLGLEVGAIPKGNDRIWALDEMDELRERFAKGERIADIAAAFGRTEASVAYKASKLGLFGTRNRPTPRGGFPAVSKVSTIGRIAARRKLERFAEREEG